MLKKIACLTLAALLAATAFTQEKSSDGILAGNIMDEAGKPLAGATSEIISLADTFQVKAILTDKDGNFSFGDIPYGYYRLRISYVGFQQLIIDSIFFREERSDFNMGGLTLRAKNSENLGGIVVYAEKPLIESKDGNITFNASESALAAGSTASDLLTNVPLVAKDPDGKISVRGKEPKILIDDKPVELNMQQLQDLLESMPGSSIEKIEVMTNPPPQYANEQGGVINIVTKKGKVGKTGRLNISGGTRGEASVNGNFTYRKQGFAIAINGGASYNRFEGNGYSYRNNVYADSSNFFNTQSNNMNKGFRPNLRVNADYDLNKYHSLNAVLQLNSGNVRSSSFAEYENINRFNDIYRLSERTIKSDVDNYNSSLSLSYLMRTKRPLEQLKVFLSANYSTSDNNRNSYQQYFYPDHTPTGKDTTQQQLTDNKSNGYNMRADYTRPLKSLKTFLIFGSYYLRNNSDVVTDISFFKKSDSTYMRSDPLSNNLRFHQTVVNFRASVKQLIGSKFSITAGVAAEQTHVLFELLKENREAGNSYWTWLPFANINKSWDDKLNLSFAWRRSIRRPGINEMNPTIADPADPYNIRFGNEKLEASTADNFDLVVGKTTVKYYVNLGVGHNLVKDIFSMVRTLLPDGKTQITWENINGRKEYEISTWGGLTLARKLRTSLSASYTYNEYSSPDTTLHYRNGGSFTSNFNTTYTLRDVWNFTGSFTFNRFATPQGYASWNWSTNLGIQRKLLNKRLTATINFIDIFSPQRRKSITYGTTTKYNFVQDNYSSTNTRNVRFTLGYNFISLPKKKPAGIPVKK